MRTANLEPPKTRGPAPFTQLSKALKAAIESGYSVKIELSAGAPQSNVTALDAWKQKRDAR